MAKGYVYILTNPAFKENWVKIGKSSRPVELRASELDTTAVPLPFEIYATMQTELYNEAERLMHKYIGRFTNLRIRENREFFNVSPEVALEIFYDIKEVIPDAVIECTFKKTVTGEGNEEKRHTGSKQTGKKEWIIPCNSRYFNVEECFRKYGQVFWSQNFNFMKGDTGYIYSSNPDSAIRWRFEVVESELPYSPEMEVEREFHVNAEDFDAVRQHNRFALLKFTGETKSTRLTLPYLMDNGLKMAPRGAINLTYEGYSDLKKYIEDNF